MKLTKSQLKQIIKEELEAVLSDGHPSEETIRQNLSHIRGSKADIFTQAIVDISTLLNRVSDSADPGMAFDDSGEDLDQRDEDYGAWNDQLDQVEQDPVYRKAVQDLIGLNVTAEDGTEIPIVSVDMRGDGYTAETAVDIRFGNFLRKSGKSRTMQRPILVDEMGVDHRTVQKITEIN